jgi:ATP-dependent DNA ligase
MGLEGIVSKRLGSRYRSGRSKDWLKFKNPEAPAVKREAEEEWAKGKARYRQTLMLAGLTRKEMLHALSEVVTC